MIYIVNTLLATTTYKKLSSYDHKENCFNRNNMCDSDIKSSKINKDELTNAIGEFGIWHKWIMIIMFLPTKSSMIWTQIGIVFFAPKTTFRCHMRLGADEILNSTCYDDCLQYTYFSEFDNSIISEWDLICERGWLANLTQTMCMFGLLIGSVLFGFQGDRYGRRPALLTASALLVASSWAIAFCRSLWQFAALRLLQGTAISGTMIIPHIILMEIISPMKREMVHIMSVIPLTIGQMLMPLLAYYYRSWDQICLGIAILNSTTLIFFFIVPESPKWLIIKGNLERATQIMTSAAKCNGLPTEGMSVVAVKLFNEATANKQKIKATYLDLIRKRSWRYKNICSCICWFLLGLGYYGCNQYIGQTSENVFAAVAMAGALQIPGIIISGICCKRFGRRWTLIVYLIIAAVSNAMLIFPDEWFYAKLVIGSLGVSTMSGAFCTMYMFTIELFPTVARNMAMGASSTSSRVGSMLAPFIAGSTSFGRWVPPSVFAVSPLLAAVTCYFLPETRGVKLDAVLV